MSRLRRRIADSPLGGSPAVLAGLLLWNAGNYAFFLLAGRTIMPDDYGVVAALLAATLIVLVPSGALRIGVSRRLAALGSHGRADGDELVRRVLRWAAIAGVAVPLAPLVLPSTGAGPIILTGCAIIPMGILSVGLGAPQGHQRFGAFAWELGMLGAPRHVAFALLAVAVSGVTAAMGATAFTIAAAAILSAVEGARRIPRAARERREISRLAVVPDPAWRSLLKAHRARLGDYLRFGVINDQLPTT